MTAASALSGQTALIGLPTLHKVGREGASASREGADETTKKTGKFKATTINGVSLPVQLRIGKNIDGGSPTSITISASGKKKDSTVSSTSSINSSSGIGNGMEVIKIAENGKRQERRVGISSDGRVLLVASEKGGGMRNPFRKRSGLGDETSSSFKRIEISSIDRIVRGQLTRTFLAKTKLDNPTSNVALNEERIALSIVFRINTASTRLIAAEENLTITNCPAADSFATSNSGSSNSNPCSTGSNSVSGSLDLIIPSHNDYEVLVRTLESLIAAQKKYQQSVCRDILLLQYHWMDIGKSLGDRMRQGEWTILCCDRLSAPTKRSVIVSLYRKYCIAAKTKPEEGLYLPKAVGLLEHTRKISFREGTKVDPCDTIWSTLLQHNIAHEYSSAYESDNDSNDDGSDSDSDESTMKVDRSVKSKKSSSKKSKKTTKKKSTKYETISADAFLKFLRKQQKDTKATTQRVKDLFERLNSIPLASQINNDGITTKEEHLKKARGPLSSSSSSSSPPRSSASSSFSRKHITKAVFLNFILSDSNDAFDPDQGQWEKDDMTQPLSSYWINSSHDTYLTDAPPTKVNNKFHKTAISSSSNASVSSASSSPDCSPANVIMYANALYRGCRCLDMDVWDGKGTQKGQPVIKFDAAATQRPESSSYSNSSVKSGSNNNTMSEPILFSDAIYLIRSFLISNPNTLPILLFIENHCKLPNQEKMAKDLKNILGSSRMVYIPSGGEEKKLPSPDEMRGKVAIKFKIAGATMSAVFDDHDDDIDVNPFVENKADAPIHEDEEEIQAHGLRTIGSVISDTPHNNHENKSPIELQREADTAERQAKAAAAKADEEALNAKVKANRAKEFAEGLLKKANMTTSEARRELKRQKVSESSTFGEETSISPSTATSTVGPSKLSVILQDTLPDPDSRSMSTGMGTSLDDETNITTSEDNKMKSDPGFMSRFFLCNDAYYSDSDDSDDDYDDETKAGSTVFSRGKTTDDEKTFISRASLRSEGWVQSTPEFKQYKSDQRKSKQKGKGSDKKLGGINEHEERDGIEVEDFFSGTVDHAIDRHTEAEKKKNKAAEVLSVANEVLNKCKKDFDDANKQYNKAKARRDRAQQTMEVSQGNATKEKNSAERSQNILAAHKEAVNEYTRKVKTAATASETAVVEARMSEDRVAEAEKAAKRAKAAKNAASNKAKYETNMEAEAEKAVSAERKIYREAEKNFKLSQSKWKTIVDGLARANRQINDIESSPQFTSEQKEIELGSLKETEGKMTRRLRIKKDEKFSLEDKLHKATRDKDSAEEKQAKAKRSLDDHVRQCNVQRKKAQSARDEADNAAVAAEQQAELAEEEIEAAKMRLTAREKAEATLQRLQAQLTKVKIELQEAEAATEEAVSTAVKSQAKADKSKRNAIELEDLDRYLKHIEKKQKQLKNAEKAHKKAVEAHDIARENWDDARNALNKNADIYYKAKIDANLQQSRANAAQSQTHNALLAYERYMKLADLAYDAKKYAHQCKVIAAEKVADHRHAQDYTRKKALIHSISSDLSKMTLLHSVKFRTFEKSKALPFNHMHSFSEGMLYQIYKKGEYDKMDDLIRFNKTHLTRVFPSKHQVLRTGYQNYNPVLPWSLGCQVASMNQQRCDAFVIANDGRFRVNGSCGYVLKPESMIERKGGDISRRNKAHANLPRQWNIKILSGYNLPKPPKKAVSGGGSGSGSSSINPFVKVTLYDGQNTPPVVHVTETIEKNGLNPVWHEIDGILFKVKDPSTAIISFSVWDRDGAEEEFIAGAAIPVSCMRQGYRSVSLFDANHRSCGSHAYTMLLAHIDGRS